MFGPTWALLGLVAHVRAVLAHLERFGIVWEALLGRMFRYVRSLGEGEGG
jgi:hypothetical protein